jgi:N-acetylglucosaminyl-diphospho-decaprenol L-rhamnosyltransferase
MSLLISIVSHKQGDLVYPLLKDLQYFCSDLDFDVILTLNLPEKLLFKKTDFGFKLEIHENERPKGFGANHNNAFKLRESQFFCILNPDLRLIEDPFSPFSPFFKNNKIGVAAPLIKNTENTIEDSARRLPTPARLLRRYLWNKKSDLLDYKIENKILFSDWLAGIFMFFKSSVFAEMNGFDERYFLYFEDVDLCCRLRLAGYQIILDPRISVIHNARRESHKNRQYLWWHIQSGLQFFLSRVFWASWLFQFNKGTKKTSWI